MKNISIIGSTGSIGRQALEVISKHNDMFCVAAMAAGGSAKLFESQINLFRPKYCALADEEAAKAVKNVPEGTVFSGGERAALCAATFEEADIVLVAASGFAGLKYSLAAINAGKTLALANKETLVCGGGYVTELARRNGVEIIPVDSEHSAIWQCLNFDKRSPFRRLIITASGGPFKDFTHEQLKGVTPQMALKHPTWNMGAKITTDSATMLNKGFEVIEAHHLFGADYSAISAVIHPQSIVHSMVEFSDGACLAQLSTPSMKLPIQLAFTFPDRLKCGMEPLDFSKALSLEFFPVEKGKYPCFDIALECGKAGGTLPCAMNAAGEEAVGAFLKGKIGFCDIARVIDGVLQHTAGNGIKSYDALLQTDAEARRKAREIICNLSV